MGCLINIPIINNLDFALTCDRFYRFHSVESESMNPAPD